MAILISTGAKAKRSVIERELRALLARVRVIRDELDRAAAMVFAFGQCLPRDPRLSIRVQCLRLAVQALTGQESQDTTLPGAIARIHQDAVLEIRA